MSKRLTTLIAALAVVVTTGAPAAASDVAQPTELEPPPGEAPVLYPPDQPFHGEARIVIVVDDQPILVAWGALTSMASDVGAWVSGSTTGTGLIDGRQYEYAITVIEVPSDVVGAFLGRLDELGSQVSFDIDTFDAGSLSAVVTLTDDAEPFTGQSQPGGRIDQALRTAGDVLVTIVSFLIVAAAVIVPAAVLGFVAFLIWRAVRRRWPITELDPVPSEADSEDVSV